MAYVNSYVPPPAPECGGLPIWPRLPDSELYGPIPYDINFAYPLHEDTLQSERLKLVPFIPSIHAETYWRHTGDRSRELFCHYPFFYPTLADTLSAFEYMFRRPPGCLLFAAIDKTRADAAHPEWGGSLAGTIAVVNSVPHNLTTEVGYVLVFPEFQKTHVAKSMVAIILRYMLQPPSASPPGMGFRRVVWSAHPDNTPSIGLAQRLGFKREGTFRWYWVLPHELYDMGRKPVHDNDPFPEQSGRDSVVLALCWDDWESGVREQVAGMIGK